MAPENGPIRTASGRIPFISENGGIDDGAPMVVLNSDQVTSPALTEASSNTLGGNQYFDSAGYEITEEKVKHETVEEPQQDGYEPIRTEDRAILTRLATIRSKSFQSSRRESKTEDLERQGTLDGLELDDPVLDPTSDKFDLHKWIRITLSLIGEQGIEIARAGVSLQNVNVSGKGSAINTQATVSSVLSSPLRLPQFFVRKPVKHILHSFDVLMKSGEMLIVLGRPGSGCSTLLKTICGELHGLQLSDASQIHYNGIDQHRMMKEFKGEVVYNQEVDKHFPHLTVGETLEHAASMRTPRRRPLNVSRKDMVKHVTQVVMAVYGLSHTYNTKVGNDFVRGVSGGERKRVSIAELALAGAAVVAWDNSTRGLDSATALTFAKSLRQTANLVGSAHAVAIYQASQAIYDLFDKAIVLYEGRQIFFGKASEGKAYFERMGWSCPARQTTGDFLTSVTNPAERTPRDGFEEKVPRTPEEFEQYWRASPEFARLQEEIAAHEKEYPEGENSQLELLRQAKADMQVRRARAKSPYVISVGMQVKQNMKRAWQRIRNDPPATITPWIGNIIMSLIIGSVFYNSPASTSAFTARGAVLFFAVLINALTAISEINSLYAQRPIVEKHKSYAFYHPWTEALAGIVLDIPIKFLQAVFFNVILYFLSGLRREPSQFFIFFLVNFITTFVMSAVFRTVAAVTKTVSQAMSIAGLVTLILVIYTGFVVPIPYMKVWFGWLRYPNPIYWAFEILIANEFHGREFACSQFVPSYPSMTGQTFVCSTQGAITGDRTVSGDAYIRAMYEYSYSHVWRNFGILIAFLVAFMIMYLFAVELNSSTSSTAEVLVFRRGHVPRYLQEAQKSNGVEEGTAEKQDKPVKSEDDEEDPGNVIPPQKDIFTWRDVNYDITLKGGSDRRLLDHVSGYVKPGTLTALMGTSGAGKTTLLDVLAQRTTTGVVTGSMFVNGAPLDSSFPRQTGYVMQQDLHLNTATVRESLRFSAMLRQPKSVSQKEKYDYVEDIIKMLGMEEFAEAVVGEPGEGLNVEQRKLLTIGVELAAKPKLLLFLDEPTSGLDSQSSFAICSFLRKLADSGQAVLCTIHQPSAILFEQFDRLLFLRKGGQTVYFGDVGKNSRTLLDYFEDNGARKCEQEENPAEYMLEIAADEKYVDIWRNSQQAKHVQSEIEQLHEERKSAKDQTTDDSAEHLEFAMPFTTQLYHVTYRIFQQYWRMPSYIFAKMILTGASGLFIGFSFFSANASLNGMQTVLYALFMLTTIFSSLVQQIMPLFVTQRALYEVRERPSRTYTWKAFLIANIVVEIPYQIFAGILTYATFYYAVVGIQSSERQGLILLYCIIFLIYASTFAHMCIAALPDAQTAGAIVTILFSMTLIFCGVMQPASALPGFWIFMYRVSPFTYWVSGMSSTLLHGRQVTCSQSELSVFDPPAGQTCGQYLEPYLTQAPGTLQNPNATSNCGYCSLRVADQFLSSVGMSWSQRWRNFGLIWAYVLFNVAAAVLLFYLFRVRPGKKKSRTKSRAKKDTKDAEKEARDEDSDSGEAHAQSESAERPGLYHTTTRNGTMIVRSVLNYNEGRVRTNERNVHVI